MAVRAVLKMIEKREAALAARAPKPEPAKRNPTKITYDSDSADDAMKILGIGSVDEAAPEGWGQDELKLETWAAQAAISRPGRARLSQRDIDNAKLMIKNPEKLKWPQSRTP
jgi:hypothetical protein